MINYGKQYIDTSDITEVQKTLKSNFLTQGPRIKIFEQKISKYFSSKYSTVVSNGSAALVLAGKILNWKKDDWVITTPLTFVATANAVLHSGAKVALVDIDEHQTINCEKLEELIISLKRKKRKVHTVIGVDYSGNVCDWERLQRIKKKYGLKLLNDNCHAMGTKFKNSLGYALKYADIVTMSFHPVKSITTGEGGAILTNNKLYKKKADILRSQGVVKDKKNPWFYDVVELSSNYRLSDINCSLGITQIRKLNKFILKRRKIAKIYDKIFSESPIFILPKFRKNCLHSYHLYPLQINFKKTQISKKDFFKFFSKKKINFQVHYVPLYKFTIYKNILKSVKFGEFSNTELFYDRAVSLPIFFSLSEKRAQKIGRMIFNYIENNLK